MNRRQLLLTVGGILPAVSGCLGSGAAPGEATDTPTESPTPADACERDLERIDPWWTVESGPLDGFDLSVSKDSVPIGGTLTVELTNVTDER